MDDTDILLKSVLSRFDFQVDFDGLNHLLAPPPSKLSNMLNSLHSPSGMG